MSRIFFLCLLLLTLNGCVSRFTQENILRLRLSMPAEEVIAIFGNPIKTEAGTCGQAIGRPWTCITWWYDSTSILDAKRLTFHVEDGRLYLNSWHMP